MGIHYVFFWNLFACRSNAILAKAGWGVNGKCVLFCTYVEKTKNNEARQTAERVFRRGKTYISYCKAKKSAGMISIGLLASYMLLRIVLERKYYRQYSLVG